MDTINKSNLSKQLKALEEAHRQISLYHTNERARSSIIEAYHIIKNEIYFPHLVKDITRIVNNCKTCLETKYERKPIKTQGNYSYGHIYIYLGNVHF